MKRTGITLIETIFVLPLFAFIWLLFSQLFPVAIRDVPRMQEGMNQQRQVQHVLSRIQSDMDAAIAIPQSFEKTSTAENRLLIHTPDGVLIYEVNGETVHRRGLSGTQLDQKGEWTIPGLVLTFHPWKRNDKTYAVDVHSAIRTEYKEREKEHFSNHRLYFLPAPCRAVAAEDRREQP